MTPGLIDWHTQLVDGGDRAAEFETRLNGADACVIAEPTNAQIVSPETLDFLVPYLDLTERLARFYRQMARGRLARVRLILSGELADYDTTPLKAAALRGLLSGISEERVNLVNAALIARHRGI